MTQAEKPEETVLSSSELIVNVPIQNNERPENDQRWVFQRLADWAQEFELRLSTHINNNRFWLTLVYISLFIVAAGRLALHFWIIHDYTNEFLTNDRRVAIAEAALSLAWLVYFIIVYTKKLKISYRESACRSSVMFVLFCIQYFTLCFWVIEVFLDFARTWECLLAIILLIVYGFLAEKSPNALAIAVYCVFMCFAVECLVRLVTCKCRNPWRESSEPQFQAKRIPIVPFYTSKYEQKKCAICLRDFEEKEGICQLSCHPNHIFHSECTKEFLDRNHLCPYCRTPI